VIKKKKVNKDDFERMRYEAELLQEFNHPNIIKYKHVSHSSFKDS
jgi:hypothetical protein